MTKVVQNMRDITGTVVGMVIGTTAAQKYLLVKYEDNWGDEMDIYGVQLMTGAEFEALKNDIIMKIDFPTECGIGTNEEMQYNSARDVIRSMTAIEIAESTFNDLRDKFTSFGKFPYVEDDGDECRLVL